MPKKAAAVEKASPAKGASAPNKVPTGRRAATAKKVSASTVKKTVKTNSLKGRSSPAAVVTPPSVVTNADGNLVTSAGGDNGGLRQRMLQKGRGVVDVLSGKVGMCHVYEHCGEVYQCTLNQTHVSANKNKYFILQLLQDDHGSKCHVFTRWGRVGYRGQSNTEEFFDAAHAMRVFHAKFASKTGNSWSNRAHFSKVEGRYELMDIDYGAAAEEEQKQETMERNGEPVASVLPTELQDLMKLIGSESQMMYVMREFEINTERMPLGKISKVQITRAYQVLRSLEAEMKKGAPQLEQLSNQFYTLIPHALGVRRPPIIDSDDMLRKKMEMLETLGKLEIAVSILSAEVSEELHPDDKLYRSLKCELKPLARDDPNFRRIEEYARNTHGPSHKFRVEVTQVFTVRREGEEERYSAFKKLGNRQMLWHGSRITNFIGILAQGLRIAPPEAPCTGYMFGKGIYLADVCTKSASYCYPAEDTNIGLILLCEAALGKQSKLTAAAYMEKPMRGTNATKGVGTFFPDPDGAEVVDGVLWPKGRLKEERTSSSLIYPEHIIYDVEQCKISYLVQVKIYR
ncbi:putative poly(ADP-ribose) polymerase [Trypanosoma rangeli]|uniref:Poly [ADP-ribose] polymerase n=1 Tax=Trypanosoma rangeli TaxID=5698 RepID=A0A422NFT1_TRYRA|nr:putative poly(ADP-ribose) polymerase [Trypanosoma rangeli]RNF04334.1 putative poly(ADP-ribose) polymerase [Trypanosoma rangeli]|eukprot:RNF04334.1 putative poly(ADP-ribose) polymerase [Trypanosoma rangeli]